MTADGFARIKEILFAVADLAPADRAAFLDDACRNAPELRAEVEAMLAHDAPNATLGLSRFPDLSTRGATIDTDARADGALQATPERIGTYTVHDVLGRGGMGVVYRARPDGERHDVALKMLPAEWHEHPDRLARFTAEARILASINHPNIPKILSLEEEAGVPFLTMELIDGADLRKLLADGGLPIERSVAIARQIASALEAAHARGIVHRDVKPANVMVTPEGAVKVLDLGIARALWGEESWGSRNLWTYPSAAPAASSTDDASSASPRTALAGTPGYISPEQLSGERTSALVDVWALGCLLYECLTGRQAFTGDTPAESLRSTLERTPHFELLPEATPPALRALVESCLQKAPDERPDSMAEVRGVLERLAAELEVTIDHAPPGPTTNLPHRLTTFIGRTRETAELRARLETHRLVTLTGAGGSGKTRLSLEVAEALADTFPAGVVQVELASVRSASFVAKTVAAVLGVGVPEGMTPVDVIARHLGDRRVLLLLDNCEHLRDACVELIDQLLTMCANVRVMATSREPLGHPLETVYAVAPLATAAAGDEPSEAERLFVDRARTVSPGWTPDGPMQQTVRAICTELDGIPLAIELAAARMRTLSLDELKAGLDRSLGLLTGGAHSTLPRHETLRGVIDWSYAQLTDEERVVLRRVACCPAGLTVEAAAAICTGDEIEPGAVPAILDRLVERSLVAPDIDAGRRAEQTRYRMLSTVREYGWERLTIAGEIVPVRTRQLVYYGEMLTALRAGRSNKALSLARVDVDHDNIVDALLWDEGDAESNAAAMRLALDMSAYWHVRNHSRLAVQIFAALYERDLASDPDHLRVRMTSGAGRHAYRDDDLPEAHRHFQRFLTDAVASGDRRMEAEALDCVGLAEPDPDAARTYFERALRIQHDIGDAFGAHLSTVYLGNLAQETADYPAARAFYEESIERLDALPAEQRRPVNRMMVLLNLVRVALAEGETASQREHVDRVVAFDREDHQWAHLSSALGVKGDLERLEGNVEAARAAYRESLMLRRDRGGTDVIGEVMRGVAALDETRDPERCARILGASHRYRRRRFDVRTPARDAEERLIARVRERLGDAAFDRAWARGEAMSRIEAVDHVLEHETMREGREGSA